jgi:serine/threonine-protein kinase
LNDIGRLPGSTRFMAPEEMRLGDWIDERATVFNLGRAGLVFLAGGKADRAAFRGNDALHRVLMKACAENPGARFQSVSGLHLAWQAAPRADAV